MMFRLHRYNMQTKDEGRLSIQDFTYWGDNGGLAQQRNIRSSMAYSSNMAYI